MTSEKDISSTERLLQVIRRSGDEEKNFQRIDGAAVSGRQTRHRLLPARSRDYVGVEIFRDRLNLVCMAREKDGWRAINASSTPLPEGLSLEHSDFPFFLRTQIQNVSRSRRSEIWVCLPPSKGEVWTVHVPRVKRGLTNAVYWSARREKTFDENEYFFDYRIRDVIADQGAQKLVAEVCIASAREINVYKRIFSEIGYRLTGVTLPAYSLKNLFIHNWIDPGDDPYAVLYIGEEASYIDLHGRRTTLFNRVIKTGRDSILDSMIMGYTTQGMEPENAQMAGPQAGGAPDVPSLMDRQQAAQRLKQPAVGRQEHTAAGPETASADPEVFEMIRPALERLARQLERTIDHSVNVLSNPAPERIYICGGISFVPGLAEFFSEQLGIPAVIMDIPGLQTSGYEEHTADLSGDERLSLVSTTALAMPSDKTINFLHTAVDMDKERRALRNTNIVAAACALLFVLTAGYWWSARHELQQARKQTETVEQQLEEYTPRLREEDLASLAGKLEGQKDRLREFSRKLQPVAVFTELNRLTPDHIKLLSVRLEPDTGKNQTRANRPGALTVEGFIRSDPQMFETHLTGYLLRLRRSALFEDSSIQKNARDTLPAGEDVYRFTLLVDLKQV